MCMHVEGCEDVFYLLLFASAAISRASSSRLEYMASISSCRLATCQESQNRLLRTDCTLCQPL